jgi:transposase-like protein
MPWTDHSLMDERMIFIAGWLVGEETVSALCVRHGISRKTGHKWLARYRAAGGGGLRELSSARHTQTHAIARAMADPLPLLRRARPTWGPRKLLARLALDDAASGAGCGMPGVALAAASTVGDLLRRHDLTRKRRRMLPASGTKAALSVADAPNRSWAIDFKGWFRTGDGVRCEPLTITDGYSHYACRRSRRQRYRPS